MLSVNGWTQCKLKNIFKTLQNGRVVSENPHLINFGSCSFHIVHSAFQAGAERTSWNIKKIYKAIWQILHDSPAWRNDYYNITEAITCFFFSGQQDELKVN